MTDQTNTRRDSVWKSPHIAKNYLNDTRKVIPLHAEQVTTMLSLIAAQDAPPKNFLDVGCGDGILGAAILERYPDAQCVFFDFSQAMLDVAQKQLGASESRHFINTDYADPAWVDDVQPYAPFDTVVSGYSIHHQPDETKKRIYKEIYELLTPGGIFINIEHVSPASPWGQSLFDNHLIDGIHAQANGTKTRAEVARDFFNAEERKANILAPAQTQCEWLRDIGYEDVDIYFKIYELAIMAGRRPYFLLEKRK